MIKIKLILIILISSNSKVIISIKKRKRGRSVNVFHYSYCVQAQTYLSVLKQSSDTNRLKRLETDMKRSETIMLYMIDGLKRSQNHVHVSKS
jgi:hypothetical protein